MDPQRLSAIATDAIEHTLRYHLGPDASLDEDERTLVTDAVHELFHLRERAKDIEVAHLEIACDAAVSFAEAFNRENPGSRHINPRWFYACVQGLLSIEFKPELFQDGHVERLARLAEQHGGTTPDTSSEAGSSSSGFSLSGDDSSSRETSVDRSVTVDSGSPVAMKDPKTKWDDDELRQMVRLKDSGLTHKAVAERLGRTQSAVENKYGRMMHSRAVTSPALKRRHHKGEVMEEDAYADGQQPDVSSKRSRRTI